MGTKSDDFFAVHSCSACHFHLDQHRLSREDTLYYTMRGLQRTMNNWVTRGLVVVPQDTHREKPSSKIVARRHLGTGTEIIRKAKS